MRCLMLLAILPVVALAEDDLPIYVYPSPRAAMVPVIDGRLDDAAWSAAPSASGFVWYDRLEALAVQTSFSLVWDDDALYLGVRCDEPQIDKLTPLPVPRDAHQVFGTEAIEFFLEPAHEHALYYQWAANAAGSVYDSRLTDPAFQSDATAAAQLGEGAWSLELRIPWAPLEVTPKQGQVLGFNVCRDRTLLQAREWSCWAPVKANFHDPERFAHLVLAPTPQQLTTLGAEFRKGGRSGPLRIFAKGGVDGQTYLGLAQAAVTRVEDAIAVLRKVGEGEQAAVGDVLAKQLGDAEGKLAVLRALAKPGLDGAEFARIELALTALERELGVLLWEARLSALLAGI